MSLTDAEAIIPLLIKAPNQKIDDMMVNCNSNWTVYELKSHLSEVYPSKPHPKGQKLIYSGKLLLDNMVVTDVLKSYHGHKNNTIHLVCSLTRDNLQFENKAASEDIKLKNPPEKVAESSLDGEPPNNTYPVLNFASTNAANDYAQIYYERVYLINSYMQYISHHVQSIRNCSMVNRSARININYEEPEENLRNNFDDLPDNDENMGDDERQINRDWLDWIYLMSRVVVLSTIVYFYSSPLRCMLVTAMALILYHLGMFRLRQLPLNNIFNNFNNNNNNNNNGNEQDTADELQEDLVNNTEAPTITERYGWIKTTINFVVSFLLSVVPDNREN